MESDSICYGSCETALRPARAEPHKKGATKTAISYEYDSLCNLKKVDFPSGTDTEFTTLANGLRESMKDESGEKRYYYDMALRVIKVEQGPQGFVVRDQPQLCRRVRVECR